MEIFRGIGATDKTAVGTAVLVGSRPNAAEAKAEKAAAPAAEAEKLQKAVAQSRRQIEGILENAEGDVRDIVKVQLDYLEDPELVGEAERRVLEEGAPAPAAILQVAQELYDLLYGLNDEVIRERAADIIDAGNRIYANLTGGAGQVPQDLPQNSILVAEELTPSQTAQLDKSRVAGFVTEKGGATSHVAIMARALGVAAVVGCAGITGAARTGAALVVDAAAGTVLLDPDEARLQAAQAKQRAQAEAARSQAQSKNEKLCYQSGRPILVAANIGNVAEAELAKESGADAVGLFRSEFLFMDRREMPGEAEQYQAYARVCALFEGAPVVIRTLDVGGDKPLPYLEMPKEENPFLGVRAIRLCLKYPQLFKTQLRALLRAGTRGNLHIMFPMVSNMQELRDAKALLEECKTELAAEGLDHAPNCPVGMMVETPAAAVLAGDFAKQADFFSIGTNDLTQYTLAMDRGNAEVAPMADPLHPAVLELVRGTITAAHQNGLWCGVCGELAADPRAIPSLAGFGLDEFSVSPGAVAATKALLLQQPGVERAAHG